MTAPHWVVGVALSFPIVVHHSFGYPPSLIKQIAAIHWEFRVINMKKRKPSSAAPSGKRAAAKPPAKRENQASGDEITRSTAFQTATAEAESYVKDAERLRKLVGDAREKINHIPRGPFAETWPYLMAMIRLIRAFHQHEYRDISAQNLLVVVAAIIYFVSPFDVIPDSVPILGNIDDAFVVRLAMKSVGADLDAFMAWETSRV